MLSLSMKKPWDGRFHRVSKFEKNNNNQERRHNVSYGPAHYDLVVNQILFVVAAFSLNLQRNSVLLSCYFMRRIEKPAVCDS